MIRVTREIHEKGDFSRREGKVKSRRWDNKGTEEELALGKRGGCFYAGEKKRNGWIGMQDNRTFQSWGSSFLTVMVILGSQRLSLGLSRRGQGWDRRLGRGRGIREKCRRVRGLTEEICGRR